MRETESHTNKRKNWVIETKCMMLSHDQPRLITVTMDQETWFASTVND